MKNVVERGVRGLAGAATSVLALAAALAGCQKKEAAPQPPAPVTASAAVAEEAPLPPPPPTVRVSGSSALLPLVNAAKEQFEATHKGVVVQVAGGGSLKGLADASSGAADIGDSDIGAPDDVKGALVDHKIAVVGFAVMANKGRFNDRVRGLSLRDMSKIFTGSVTNWKAVGGANQPIVVINRALGSGTRTVFGNIVLGGDKFVDAPTEESSQSLAAKLKETTGAISYLSLSTAEPELRTLAITAKGGAIQPSPTAIAKGQYPIWSYEHMYTRGQPTGLAKEFIDYVMSTDFQEHVLTKVPGFVAISQMKVSRDRDSK
jgi:phosphate transport system substrate-binding protein